MYKTITQYDFTSWFAQSDTYKNNFSYNGLIALYEYLENYENETGESIEFDPIALCCEYSEYDSAYSAVLAYNEDYAQNVLKGSEDCEEQALEWLQERTQVIEFDGGIIIQQF